MPPGIQQYQSELIPPGFQMQQPGSFLPEFNCISLIHCPQKSISTSLAHCLQEYNSTRLPSYLQVVINEQLQCSLMNQNQPLFQIFLIVYNNRLFHYPISSNIGLQPSLQPWKVSFMCKQPMVERVTILEHIRSCYPSQGAVVSTWTNPHSNGISCWPEGTIRNQSALHTTTAGRIESSAGRRPTETTEDHRETADGCHASGDSVQISDCVTADISYHRLRCRICHCSRHQNHRHLSNQMIVHLTWVFFL